MRKPERIRHHPQAVSQQEAIKPLDMGYKFAISTVLLNDSPE